MHTLLGNIRDLSVLNTGLLQYLSPKDKVKFLQSDEHFATLLKKYEQNQLNYKHKIEKSRYNLQLGSDDLAEGYNVDWEKVYKELSKLSNILHPVNLPLNFDYESETDMLKIPEDEPDYVRVFIVADVSPESFNNYILRKAIVDGYSKVVKYLIDGIESDPLFVANSDEDISEDNPNGSFYRELIIDTINEDYENVKEFISELIDLKWNKDFIGIDKKIREIPKDSIFHSIKHVTDNKDFEMLKVLFENGYENGSLYFANFIYDNTIWAEYYKKYYNLDAKSEDFRYLPAAFIDIITINETMNEYYTGESNVQEVRNYLSRKMSSVVIGGSIPAYIIFQYLVKNGAPIMINNSLAKAVGSWGYDAIKLINSTWLSLYMLDKNRALELIKIIKLEYDFSSKKEAVKIINYLLTNDVREPKNKSYAYNELKKIFSKNEQMTIYLNERIK